MSYSLDLVFQIFSMQQFPYPEYSIDYFLSSIVNFLPLLLVMAFIYSAGSFTKVSISIAQGHVQILTEFCAFY